MVTNNDMVQLSLAAKNVTRQEKPRHMKYLNEFRTQQCRLFLEQQCQFHRPYTCFHWHFPNQKRRRPFKRPDGTFNYNPDVYCDKYDEATGSCNDGDHCPYAHRNAGDTERRYHPRYFKTGNCIYETTENGSCVKNGLHCAFAHGPDDIRLPVYDIREVQDVSSKFVVNLPASLEKERVLSEDPKWNEMFHVLAFYKTELCRKPPRMCRQGYSCPFYHNGKDKRRSPEKWRYRSTPCPTVRPNDEWQDSSLCESRDSCPYCHTRTEQQFHPEIYKSTKCNDVINSGYCPRGPFCAFAHSNCELTAGRDFLAKLQQERICSNPDHLMLPCSNATCVATAAAALESAHLHVFGTSVCPGVVATVGMQRPNASSQFFHRGSNHPFPSFTSGDVGVSDPIKRTAQKPTALIPNLMSPIGPVSIPSRSMMQNAVRGRRLDQCGSPHQGIGSWQSSISAFSPDPTGHLTTSQGVLMDSVPGIFTPELSSTPMVCSNGSVNPSQPHLPLVFSTPFILDSHIRDSARHRSGGSVSSESGVSSTVPMDDHLLHSTNLSSILGTSTYPGRSMNSVLSGAPLTISSAGIQQQQTYRSASKKTRAPSAAQFAGGPVGLRPQQYRQKVSPSARTASDPDTLDPTRSTVLPERSAALNRGELWHPAYGIASLTDRLSRPSWPWQPRVTDSGNNSEASMTETDVCGLFDSSIANISGNVTIPIPNSLLEESNRDSGLVPDFTSFGNGTIGDHLETSQLGAYCDSDQFTGRQLPSDTSYGSIAKPSTGSMRVPSDVSDEGQLPYPQFFNTRLGVLSPENLTIAGAGFHSPLDDILLNTSCALDSLDQLTACNTASVAPNASLSPIATVATSGPMAIPGRPTDTDLSAPRFDPTSGLSSHFYSALSAHSALSEQLQQPHDSNKPLLQNTWPLDAHELSEPETRKYSTDISSPIRSQMSQSFSPIVGAPLTHTRQKPTFDLSSDATSPSMEAAYACSREVVSTSIPSAERPAKLINKSSLASPSQTMTPLSRGGMGSASALSRTPAAVDFNNLPQSPILLSSPFSNPGSELERLSLQRELDEVRQRLGSKEDEVETLKKQRDFVTEHLRDSLGVIRQLFTTLNVSSPPSDLSKPLFVDTSADMGSSSGTGCSAPLRTVSDSSLDNCDEVYTSEASFIDHSTPELVSDQHRLEPSHAYLKKPALQQQQEALAALFSNPFVMALLNSNTLSANSSAESPPAVHFHHFSSANEQHLFTTQPFTSIPPKDPHHLQSIPLEHSRRDAFDIAASATELSAPLTNTEHTASRATDGDTEHASSDSTE
ncbi:unnamed protein product [Dicrocoelium dendriticum]|nr:unnamed protein product [Dicrocoelium dendriticum]